MSSPASNVRVRMMCPAAPESDPRRRHRRACHRKDVRRNSGLPALHQRMLMYANLPRHWTLAITLAALTVCTSSAVAARSGGGAATVDGARIIAADKEPQNWLAHGRTYGEQRYSPLSQINDGNVDKLGLAWSFATATTRGLQASPIVVDGVIYTTGTWSVVWALDAKTGRQLWNYDPEVPRAWGRYLCCDAVNRGVAVWKGAVYVGTIDGRLVSLDAKTGAKRW